MNNGLSENKSHNQTETYTTDKQILDDTKEGLKFCLDIVNEVCMEYPLEEKQKFIVSLFIYLMPKLYNHNDAWARAKQKASMFPKKQWSKD